MSDLLNEEKQKQRLKEEVVAEDFVNISYEKTEVPDDAAGEIEKAKVKNAAMRKSQELRERWDKPEIRLFGPKNNSIVRTKSGKSVMIGNGAGTQFIPSYYSIGDIGSVINKKKDSTMAIELQNSIMEVHALSEDMLNNKEVDMNEYQYRMFRLYICSNAYHESRRTSRGRGRSFSREGSAKKSISKRMEKYAQGFVSLILSEEQEKEILKNDFSDGENSVPAGEVANKMKSTAKMLKYAMNNMSKDASAFSPEEQFERRVRLFKPYETLIKSYRKAEPVRTGWSSDIREVIEAYEYTKRWQIVLDNTAAYRKEKYGEKEGYEDTVQKTIKEDGEVEFGEKLSDKEVDQDLTPEQVKAVEEIDAWLTRNTTNGIIIHNDHSSFINEIMHMTKRERLHMYYLVETDRRKEDTVADVGLSYHYIPKLSRMKGKMLAHKLKIWKRFTGGHVYMQKLSQAFYQTRKYSNEIRNMANLEKEKKAFKQIPEEELKKLENPLPAMRMKKFMELDSALSDYRKMLESAKEKKGKAKEAEEKNCREYAREVEALMRDVAVLDEEVGKQNLNNPTGDMRADVATAVNVWGKVGSAVSYVQSGTNFVSKYLGGSQWYLSHTGWADTHIWAGSIAASLDVVSRVASVTVGIWNLAHNGKDYNAAEIGEKVGDILANLTTGVRDGFMVKDLVQTGGDFAAHASAATTTVAVVGAGVSTAQAILKTGHTFYQKNHASKANKFFTEKRKRLEEEGDLSRDKQRELKYEKCMQKLQSSIVKKEAMNTGLAWLNAGAAIATIFVPGVGAIAAGALALAGVIANSVVAGKIKTTLFDQFFNTDAAVKLVMQKKKNERLQGRDGYAELDEEKLKVSLRKRIAAAAGFCDMHIATDYVCQKFAKLVHGKLFGGTAENEAEKKGYIEFVKGLKLPYNEKKQKPAENIIFRKLTMR